MAGVIDDTGWLGGIRHILSPNHDARPADTWVDALVIHGMTVPPGGFGHDHIARLFTNRLAPGAHPVFAALAGVRVSAHAVIERTGRVTQYVSFDARAWHAGVSQLAGRERVNDFSIGIELEGTDTCVYSPWQYRALVSLIQALQARYSAISAERIVGHADIAPGRKTDPGPVFDWPALRMALGADSGRPSTYHAG